MVMKVCQIERGLPHSALWHVEHLIVLTLVGEFHATSSQVDALQHPNSKEPRWLFPVPQFTIGSRGAAAGDMTQHRKCSTCCTCCEGEQQVAAEHRGVCRHAPMVRPKEHIRWNDGILCRQAAHMRRSLKQHRQPWRLISRPVASRGCTICRAAARQCRALIRDNRQVAACWQCQVSADRSSCRQLHN